MNMYLKHFVNGLISQDVINLLDIPNSQHYINIY
jgi:hypothetical protein